MTERLTDEQRGALDSLRESSDLVAERDALRAERDAERENAIDAATKQMGAEAQCEQLRKQLSEVWAGRDSLYAELSEAVAQFSEVRAERDRLREELTLTKAKAFDSLWERAEKSALATATARLVELEKQLSEARAALETISEMHPFGVEPCEGGDDCCCAGCLARAALKSSLQRKPEDVKAWAEAAAEDWVSHPDPVDSVSEVKPAPEEEESR